MKVEELTKRMQKQAYVEVVCGLDHRSIWVPGRGWSCRYARGYVVHQASGLRIRKHQCHWCNGYRLVPALLPVAERLCDNCGGPLAPSGQPNCWPDLVVVEDFAMEDK